MTHRARSGAQYALRAGEYEAVVASVGAALRSLTYRGRDLIVPFDADEVRPAFRGALLAPWPNRVIDGEYDFGGARHRLAITEPERGHALHGLVAWLDFAPTDDSGGPGGHGFGAGDSCIALAAVIEPQAGYPWRISLSTTFTLDAAGLTQTVRAVNESETPAPFGVGAHPYLVAGKGRVDDWMLELPARDVLDVTGDRLVPIGVRAVVDDERLDFRIRRRVGATEIDHAFTGLNRDAVGRAQVRVTDASGSGVAMTWDDACRWVQIHTADRAGAAGHRIGLAVEPMTCPPDAFNTGTDLLVLPPNGGAAEASWTISAVE